MLLLRAHRRCSVVSGGRCINANRQGSHRTRKRTNAGMQPVAMACKIAQSLAPRYRELMHVSSWSASYTSLETKTSVFCRNAAIRSGEALCM